MSSFLIPATLTGAFIASLLKGSPSSLLDVKPSLSVVSTKYPEFLPLAPSPANCASTSIIF